MHKKLQYRLAILSISLASRDNQPKLIQDMSDIELGELKENLHRQFKGKEPLPYDVEVNAEAKPSEYYVQFMPSSRDAEIHYNGSFQLFVKENDHTDRIISEGNATHPISTPKDGENKALVSTMQIWSNEMGCAILTCQPL